MKPQNWLFLWVVLASFSAQAKEFTQEIERVIPLRSHGDLEITNNRGDIFIDGWSQDRVRLKAKRTADAASADEAKRLFVAMDIRHRVNADDIEISAEYGHGLTLEERLRERASPRSSMALFILAPSNLKMRLWAANGKVRVRGWKGALDIRSSEGPITIENSECKGLSVMCPGCEIHLLDVESKSVRVMGGSGKIRLRDVRTSHAYVETESGPIDSEGFKGEQLFVSRSGPIRLQKSKGHIGFHSQEGAVEVLDGLGYLSGKTFSGNITARMRAWEFDDKAIIESVSGEIALELPAKFSGELDLWSENGKLMRTFPMRSTQSAGEISSTVRQIGIAGEGGEVLRVHSEKGSVKLTAGK